jgi:hypothetical protein
MSRQLYYWNTADDVNHTHQRIEWSIKHGYLVCINIHISNNLFSKIKIGDVILTYEPKHHKKNKIKFDGFCVTCGSESHNGKQAFTAIFKIISQPIKLTNLEDELKFCYNLKNDCNIKQWNNTEYYDYIDYCIDYYSTNKEKYVFNVKFIDYLHQSISTNKKTNGYYTKPVIKGFDKIYTCGCKDISTCKNINCISYKIFNDININNKL